MKTGLVGIKLVALAGFILLVIFVIGIMWRSGDEVEPAESPLAQSRATERAKVAPSYCRQPIEMVARVDAWSKRIRTNGCDAHVEKDLRYGIENRRKLIAVRANGNDQLVRREKLHADGSVIEPHFPRVLPNGTPFRGRYLQVRALGQEVHVIIYFSKPPKK